MFVGILILFYLIFTGSTLFRSKDETSLILIDRSLSMAIEDISHSPTSALKSRLDLAKEIITTSFEQKQKVGVITFAKNPTLFLPISQVHSHFFEGVQSISPESDIGGSDLPLALQFAKNLYGETPLSLFIFTDGGSTSLSEVPKIPKNWRITMYGIGSEVGGKIPLGYNANGERRYKYFSGSEVIVPYERENIENVAKKIGARLIENDGSRGSEQRNLFHFFEKNVSYTLASLCILFGIFIHPYGRKKINI